jgi:nucleoside-diphosphate-sugar epimerase
MDKFKYFILGGNGTLGSAFVDILKKRKEKYKIITKDNYNFYKNKKCSIFINSNGNSSKFLASQSPQNDFEKSVTVVFNSIFDFKYDKYVFISSADVYDNLDKTSESVIINNPRNDYGKNKLISELIIRLYCKKWLIFRPSTIISIKAKKGLLYDLLNSKKVFLNPNSSYSLIRSETVAKIILGTKKNNEIFNISGTGSVKINELKKKLNSISKFNLNKKKEEYVIETKKINKLLKKPIPKTSTEIVRIIKIINFKK